MHRVFAIAIVVLSVAAGAASLTVPAIEAGGGGHGSCVPSPRDGTGEPVIIEGNCFEPAILYVEPGATVEWQQRDVIPHNVMMFGGELVGDDLEMSKGDTVTREFNEPGVFAYYCSIHPSMLGVVVAGDPASASFGAGLELRTTAEELRAITDNKQAWLAEFQRTADPNGKSAGTLDSGKGNGDNTGAGWGEAAVGLALVGGLVVGLVVAGSGLRFVRRER